MVVSRDLIVFFSVEASHGSDRCMAWYVYCLDLSGYLFYRNIYQREVDESQADLIKRKSSLQRAASFGDNCRTKSARFVSVTAQLYSAKKTVSCVKFSPVIEAKWMNVRPIGAVQKNGFCVITPWTAEKDGVWRTV